MITRLGSRSVSSFFGLVIAAVSMQLGAQPPNDPAAYRTTPIGQISVDDGAASPIYAFSFGAQQVIGDGTGGGGGAGKAVLDDISVLKGADALSTSLLGDLVTGRHLLKVRVELFESNATQVVSTFELEDVVVTRFETGGEGAETVGFKYRIVQMTSGGGTICWDTGTNQMC